MTQAIPRRRFNDVLASLGDEPAFLALHTHPALLLEPHGSGDAEGVKTPSGSLPIPGRPDLGQTVTDRITASEAFSSPTDIVHPQARVLWLAKSTRNPFAGMITLGRAKNNDLVLAHTAISKMHAIFYEVGTRWLIEDRGSTNGTYLDGVRLPVNERREVNDGAVLRFADAVNARFFEPSSFYAFCAMVRGAPN